MHAGLIASELSKEGQAHGVRGMNIYNSGTQRNVTARIV